MQAAQTCACMNLRKATRVVTQLFDETLAPTGLRSTQFVVLVSACLAGPCSIARLARELVMDRSTLTRNLKPLVDRGLICTTSPEGVRVRTVELTDSGRQALAGAIPYWQQAQARIIEQFGQDHWNRITDDLQEITRITATSPT